MRTRMTCLTKNDFIRPDCIELITGLDAEGAQREYDYINRAQGHTSEYLTIIEFCEFSGYDCREILGLLTPVGRAVELFFTDDDLKPILA